jgi:hypothetical protein
MAKARPKYNPDYDKDRLTGMQTRSLQPRRRLQGVVNPNSAVDPGEQEAFSLMWKRLQFKSSTANSESAIQCVVTDLNISSLIERQMVDAMVSSRNIA